MLLVNHHVAAVQHMCCNVVFVDFLHKHLVLALTGVQDEDQGVHSRF